MSRPLNAFMGTFGLWLIISPMTRAADWPGLRGLARDGVSAETGLVAWPKNGPALKWTFNAAGAGYGSPAVVNGTVYLLGTKEKNEVVLAIDGSGKELWSTVIGPIFDFQGNSWSGGPNATPTVADGRVYAQGSQGILLCVDATSGKNIWSVDLAKELAAEVNPVGGGPAKIGWGFSASPLRDQTRLVVATGGQGGLFTSLDPATGKVQWRSDSLKVQATYGSVTVGTFGGVRQYITMTQNGAAAVNASDGSTAWVYKRDADYPDIVACTPVITPSGVYITAGYGGEATLLKVAAKSAEPVWSAKEISSNLGGFVISGKYAFGFHGKRSWACQDLEYGNAVWTGKRNALGSGSAILADGKLIAMAEDTGAVALIQADSASYKELSRFNLPVESAIRKSGGRRWTHPALSDGLLFLRDQELLFCYKVR